ncbi:VacJ family lipoprotein [Burkholderia sp. BCC1993]|uniref:MlaA family lipoprotein n=1 Tax=Burkholderia sp. BCC1993 TaxID=2817444 RepID=UPI002AB0703C|nr:MlaA family lipoprotein [Burkholderia sp. BCC1993]
MNSARIVLVIWIATFICGCAGNVKRQEEIGLSVYAPALTQSTSEIADERAREVSAGQEIVGPLDGRDITSVARNEGSASIVHRAFDLEQKNVMVNDPWEGFNRRMHGVNNVLDRFVTHPIAKVYDTITPNVVQTGVTKFFGNLKEPASAVNQILQGRPGRAAKSLGRFVVNATVGIGGIFDPATGLGIQKEDADFGQTFAAWGWRDSRYLVLPLMGPRTLRDSVAMFGDQQISPIGKVSNATVANGLTLVQMTNARAQALPFDEARKAATDDYLFVRDAWMQRRVSQIEARASDSLCVGKNVGLDCK